jgi:hypothetical protein
MLPKMRFDVVGQTAPYHRCQTAAHARLVLRRRLRQQQVAQCFVRDFVGAQLRVRAIPRHVRQRRAQVTDAFVLEVGAVGQRQFARLAVQFHHRAPREVLGQEVDVQEVHLAAHGP